LPRPKFGALSPAYIKSKVRWTFGPAQRNNSTPSTYKLILILTGFDKYRVLNVILSEFRCKINVSCWKYSDCKEILGLMNSSRSKIFVS